MHLSQLRHLSNYPYLFRSSHTINTYLPLAFPFLSFGNSNGTFKLAFFIFAASVTVSAIPAATSFSLSAAEGTTS